MKDGRPAASALSLGLVSRLEPNEVHVHYRLIDTLSDAERARALQILSSAERERAARFAFDRDGLPFIVAHALLRQVLSSYTAIAPAAWEFVADEFGKPAIANLATEGIEFNLTHAHGLAACAVSRQAPVGIDAESTSRRLAPLDIASRHFSAAELAELQACGVREREIRFVEVWTLKEAYVKAVGTGLSLPFRTFTIRLEARSSIAFEPPGLSESRCRFALYAPSPRHRIAVAALSGALVPTRITAWGGPSGAPATPVRTSA